MAEAEIQQLALLANASLLAEELLPRAAMKLSPMYQSGGMDDARKRTPDRPNRMLEQREWKRKNNGQSINCVMVSVGSMLLNLSSLKMVIPISVQRCILVWMQIMSRTGLTFQELYAKLNRMASMAADMFIGRERFATLLLMRLTETVLLWLSEDQSFWEDIEEAPRTLGPLGLQQLKGKKPRSLSFSFGRALQQSTLKTWEVT